MPSSLPHPEPGVGTKRILKKVKPLLLEQQLMAPGKRKEFPFGGFEEFVTVGGQANPARFMT